MKLPCLWVSEIPATLPQSSEAVLSPEEIQRYQQASAPGRKLQFLATRLLLHKALSSIWGGDPSSYQVTAQAGQAPRVLHSPFPVHVSIAHTRGACAVLISESACGVDIEDASVEREFPALAKTAFNAAEFALYQKTPGREGFYALWCSKEARYKAAQPCAWEGRLGYKKYRIAAALPLTGLKNLVIC